MDDDSIFRPGPIGPESRFTPASHDCPNPSYWHSTDADSTEIEVSKLIAAFVTALQPELVVETGAAWGQTTEMVGLALARNGHGTLHSIEPDPERAEYTRAKCRAGEWLPVEVHETKSLDWRPPEGSPPIGFAFFDSLIELRVPEFKYFSDNGWWAPVAFCAFHDTADHHGLWPEIEELETQGLLLPIRLPTPRGVVIAEVM